MKIILQVGCRIARRLGVPGPMVQIGQAYPPAHHENILITRHQ